MGNTNIFITFEELSKLQKDSVDKANVIALLNTEFPDDTCQLIAIKSILGISEAEEEPEVPDDHEPDVDDVVPDDTNNEEETTDPIEP